MLFIFDHWADMTNSELLDNYNKLKYLRGSLTEDFDLFLDGLYDYSQGKLGYGVMSNLITLGWLEIRDMLGLDVEYKSQEEMIEACKVFIKEQLSTTASDVKVEYKEYMGRKLNEN